jgi:ATP-dependent 26S proteasome regulatory subunit
MLGELTPFDMHRCLTPSESTEMHYIDYNPIEGLTLNNFHVNPTTLDVGLLYGSEFERKHQKMVQLSNDHQTGITLLYGNPGTGKSNYIRYLISKVNCKVIMVPPDQIESLSQPGTMTFMRQQAAGSIIVIEDAEQALKSRESDNPSNAIYNLLAFSDGPLSDMLGIHIVCTFNCSVDEIDSALRRKGRMLVEHEFKPLPFEQAQEVARAHGLPELDKEKEYTLAEIFNQD